MWWLLNLLRLYLHSLLRLKQYTEKGPQGDDLPSVQHPRDLTRMVGRFCLLSPLLVDDLAGRFGC